MLHLVIFSFFVSSVSAGDIVDLNCTSPGKPAFTPSATGCDDLVSTPICTSLFGAAPTPAVGPGSVEDRPVKCYTDGTDPSEDAKTAAIATCPKYCGLCCQTPEYNCENARNPLLDCNRITPAQCRDTRIMVQIAQNCPNVCGFCLTGGCIDTTTLCSTQPMICVTRGMESFVADNCQRTCNLCSTSSTTAATNTGTNTNCVDANANCANWVNNGFCNSNFYTAAQKRSYCARSCNLC